jgi:hypothetical protein
LLYNTRRYTEFIEEFEVENKRLRMEESKTTY